MYKPVQFWMNFISENHIGHYEKEKGVYVPKHIGKSSIDTWISENGRDFKKISNGWSGSLPFGESRYFFESKYVNHRSIYGKSLFDSMRKGENILFDEYLSVIWNKKYGKTNFNEELMDILTGKKDSGFSFKLILDVSEI